MISFSNQNNTFYLNTDKTSYIMKVLSSGLVCHWYYGPRVAEDDVDKLSLLFRKEYMTLENVDGYTFSKNTVPAEYPVFGAGDFRSPALIAELPSGVRVNDLIYKEHFITKGKAELSGLPSFDRNCDEVDTLELVLVDSVSGYEVSVFYSVFEKENAITRHAVVKNTTDAYLSLHSVQSVSVDICAEKLDMITLHGTWARERHINRTHLCEGTASIESRSGASGHQHNPFAALVSPNTDENSGSAYGFALVYSGNYKATAETDQFGNTRFQLGINPFNFTYKLAPGESFVSPEAVCVYSDEGLGGMSECFHSMCRNHLGACADKSIKRPIVINSWEAMYFDMNEQRIAKFINDCKGLGIDTFVLDDGWFGHRNCDDSSLGDWFINPEKFPDGFDGIEKICHENGIKFGIWFEPEMISRDSKLFTEHPDWCIHIDGKKPTESRHQLVLDMSRKEVVDCIFEQMSALLERYDISYIKWDMNRNITDNGSSCLPPERQGELLHRYILGVYDLMDRLNKRFPHILFEGCAGGGGRFDFGILYYMPQFWTSDDTDAIERLKIQYGTSLVYPPSAMTAHVSACPNHQTGRSTPFKTRGDVAQMCNFGYELDVAKLSDTERAMISEQTALHRRIEHMIADGRFYRILSPFENEYCSWQLVSADKKSSFVMFAVQRATANNSGARMKLKGLESDTVYEVKPLGIELHGSTLMGMGLPIARAYRDYETEIFEITAK